MPNPYLSWGGRPAPEYLLTQRNATPSYAPRRWPTATSGPNSATNSCQYIKDYKDDGRKIAIYGAGHRACALVNFLGLASYIEFVLNDQQEKQGKYLPGSRLPILPGETLEKQFVDLCLLAVNAELDETVIGNHSVYQERGGLFASILPPSERLKPLWGKAQ